MYPAVCIAHNLQPLPAETIGGLTVWTTAKQKAGQDQRFQDRLLGWYSLVDYLSP